MRKEKIIAHFTPEIALHQEFPNYTGGLGVFSASAAFSAKKLEVPMVVVSMLYSEGYYDQGIEHNRMSVGYTDRFMGGNPDSYYLKKKIIEDTVSNKLTTVELTYYVAANYINGMSFKETVALTQAIINTGDVLTFNDNSRNNHGKKKKKVSVIDKHCIGGVAGNRTTPIVVPILVVAGLIVPKTSSRSITSPAG